MLSEHINHESQRQPASKLHKLSTVDRNIAIFDEQCMSTPWLRGSFSGPIGIISEPKASTTKIKDFLYVDYFRRYAKQRVPWQSTKSISTICTCGYGPPPCAACSEAVILCLSFTTHKNVVVVFRDIHNMKNI